MNIHHGTVEYHLPITDLSLLCSVVTHKRETNSGEQSVQALNSTILLYIAETIKAKKVFEQKRKYSANNEDSFNGNNTACRALEVYDLDYEG